MLPLQSPQFPQSASELETALAAGLSRYGLTPREVSAQGEAWPALDRLRLDLTGAQATRDLRLPTAKPAAGEEVTVGDLQIFAEPLTLEGSPVNLRLQATQARLGPAESKAGTGEPMLELRGSGPGSLVVSLRLDDLRKLALAAGRAAAKGHGADLQELDLELQGEGERALTFQARVLAKMGFMKATLRVQGRAEVDEQLQLHLSQLEVNGEGMASSLAAGLIRKQLEKAQAAPIPLSFLALGGIRLQAIRLRVGVDDLRAEAEFSG